MKKKRFMIWISLMIAVATLAGCTGPAARKPSADAVTVTDAAGREVTVASAPERIVSGYYIATSLLMALGQTDRLVGIEAKAESRPLYALAAPELIGLPSVGSAKQFDLETAVSLKPDLAVLPLKLAEAAEALDELGIPVILIAPEDTGSLLDTAEMLAAACRTDASALTGYFEEKQEFLRETLKGTEAVSVYMAGNSSYLRTAGRAMYQDALIRLGGGVNAASEIEDKSWADISREQLLAWDPDAIILAADAEYSAEDLCGDADLQDLTAVKEGRVYAMPSAPEAWDSPVPAAILGSLWIAQTLHPDIYSADEFKADVNAFYQRFYGFTVG